MADGWLERIEEVIHDFRLELGCYPDTVMVCHHDHRDLFLDVSILGVVHEGDVEKYMGIDIVVNGELERGEILVSNAELPAYSRSYKMDVRAG